MPTNNRYATPETAPVNLLDAWDLLTNVSNIRIPLTRALNAAGVPLSASPASGQFGITNTLGTSLSLVSQPANNNTITDTVVWEYVLPPAWDSTKPLILTVRGNYTLGGGTLGTNTVTVHSYTIGGAGSYGADAFAGVAAQALPSASGILTFTASANQSPGARVIISLVLALQDTAGSNITGSIGSLSISQ